MNVRMTPEFTQTFQDLCDHLPEEIIKGIIGDDTRETLKEKLCLATKGSREMNNDEIAAVHYFGVKPDTDMCFMCGARQKEIRPASMKTCGRCKKAYYCSVNCQRRHWERWHKTECGGATRG